MGGERRRWVCVSKYGGMGGRVRVRVRAWIWRKFCPPDPTTSPRLRVHARARARAKTHDINCVPHARPLPGHTPAYPHLQDLQINEQLTKNAEEIGAAYRSNDSSWGIWVTEAKNRLIKIAAASRLYLLGSKCSLASQALSPSRLLARFGVPLPRPPPRPPLEPRPAEPPRCPPRPAPPVYMVTVRFMHTKASVNSK